MENSQHVVQPPQSEQTVWQKRWLGLTYHHPDVQRLANECESFAKRFMSRQQDHRLLVLVGRTGVGKTACARQIFRWSRHVSSYCVEQKLWPKAPTGIFVPWAEVADTKTNFNEMLQTLKDEALVVIDDIGSEIDQFKSGQPTERLRLLLSERANKFTIVTTNVPPRQWVQRWEERVADRLFRGSKLVEINCPSYTTVCPA